MDVNSPSLSAIASRYKTQLTWVSLSPGAAQEILKADPRRWAVRFNSGSAALSQITVFPDVPITGTFSNIGMPQDYEWNFRDHPAAVTGSWKASAAAPQILQIVETLFIG